MGVPPLRIEILDGVSGLEFRSCYERRVLHDIGGVTARILSRDDLLANKIAAGRHKGLDDVEMLTKSRVKRKL